jgi:hypothetical protein
MAILASRIGGLMMPPVPGSPSFHGVVGFEFLAGASAGSEGGGTTVAGGRGFSAVLGGVQSSSKMFRGRSAATALRASDIVQNNRTTAMHFTRNLRTVLPMQTDRYHVTVVRRYPVATADATVVNERRRRLHTAYFVAFPGIASEHSRP